jgi:LacI family transcriptional regulator
MPTIKDVALECGVSINTVSSVLNNKKGEVSAETSRRVLEVVRRLGYRPNAAARGMTGKRSYTIGIADRYSTLDAPDQYKAQILEPLTHAVRSAKYDVLYYSGHPEKIGGFPAFLDGRSEGLVCFTGSIPDEEIAAIKQSGLPIVFIAEPQAQDIRQSSAYVDVENEKGGFLATSHLISLGHKRIGMIQGFGVSGNLDRLAGYRRALDMAGIPFNESLLYPEIAWEQSPEDAVQTMLRQPVDERPTAIFCFNDVLALATMTAAQQAGIAVPEELSIIGFDDLPTAAVANPTLTTVRQPLSQIGKRAVEILIGIIEGQIPSDYHEILEPELVVRGSTAVARIFN